MSPSATSRPAGLALLAGIILLAGLSPDALAHGIPEADRQAIIEGGNLRYLLLGAEHMVTGYDHLLFLLGVVFFLRRFGEIVKFITAFTLGHSITLLFATLLGVTANYFLIDAVIALSVIYKGFENMDGFRRYIEVEPPNLLFMVFGYGLIHGFGSSPCRKKGSCGASSRSMWASSWVRSRRSWSCSGCWPGGATCAPGRSLAASSMWA